jgi:hypothetical protein
MKSDESITKNTKNPRDFSLYMSADPNNRINLLSDLEIDAIYSFPSFNAVEQSLYFELPVRK